MHPDDTCRPRVTVFRMTDKVFASWWRPLMYRVALVSILTVTAVLASPSNIGTSVPIIRWLDHLMGTLFPAIALVASLARHPQVAETALSILYLGIFIGILPTVGRMMWRALDVMSRPEWTQRWASSRRRIPGVERYRLPCVASTAIVVGPMIGLLGAAYHGYADLLVYGLHRTTIWHMPSPWTDPLTGLGMAAPGSAAGIMGLGGGASRVELLVFLGVYGAQLAALLCITVAGCVCLARARTIWDAYKRDVRFLRMAAGGRRSGG